MKNLDNHCRWCGAAQPDPETACAALAGPPKRDNDAAWALWREYHAPDCLWLKTRAGQRFASSDEAFDFSHQHDRIEP